MIVTIVSGSNHAGSTTRSLCGHLASYFEDKGHSVHLFDVHATPLPMFCEDTKEWAEEAVGNLRTWMDAANAIVLATPEYHGSVSGALKNALDFLWPQFDGKPVLSVSVAGGPVGVSSLQHMQTMVRNCHGINSPEWISLGGANRTLDAQGRPEDERTRKRVQKAADYLLQLAERLHD